MRSVECAFCDADQLRERIIREGKLVRSFVSKPWFREGHCLVVPKRHIETVGELQPDESAEIMTELGRLAMMLDKGFGTGMMQKYQPRLAENGIKMNHLHFHTFPRVAQEAGLFPVPEPNSFDGFVVPTDQEMDEVLRRTRK